MSLAAGAGPLAGHRANGRVRVTRLSRGAGDQAAAEPVVEQVERGCFVERHRVGHASDRAQTTRPSRAGEDRVVGVYNSRARAKRYPGIVQNIKRSPQQLRLQTGEKSIVLSKTVRPVHFSRDSFCISCRCRMGRDHFGRSFSWLYPQVGFMVPRYPLQDWKASQRVSSILYLPFSLRIVTCKCPWYCSFRDLR